MSKYKEWWDEVKEYNLDEIRGDKRPSIPVREIASRYTANQWDKYVVRMELELPPVALDRNVTTLERLKEGTFFKSTSGITYGKLLHCNSGHATVLTVDRLSGNLVQHDVAPGMGVVRIAPLELKALPKAKVIAGKKSIRSSDGSAVERQGKGGGRRYDLFSYPVTAVIRWCGKQQWSFHEVKAAMKELGLEVSDGTVRAQLTAGKTGARGLPATLNEHQAGQLFDAMERGMK